MYKLLLILKYLRKRRIAWVSLVAVMLCTTMVLVVISVMGGWLRMFRTQFKGLSGDVMVRGESLTGFAHYEVMLERIRALPEVKHAVPVIRTFGLININNQIRKGVEVVGYPPDVQHVNDFRRALYRIGGNYQGVLVSAEAAEELLKQADPEKAAEGRRPPTTGPALAGAGFGLISGKRFLPFTKEGSAVAAQYVQKPGVSARVHVRATETIPLAVSEMNVGGGPISGFIVEQRYAGTVMSNEDAEEAAEHLRPQRNSPVRGFGLVSDGKFYLFDEAGQKLARQLVADEMAALAEAQKDRDDAERRAKAAEEARPPRIAEAEAARKEAEKALPGRPRVYVSGTASAAQYDAEAISAADRVDFALWPHEAYLPPLGYKGSRDPRRWGGMIVGSGVVGIRKDRQGNIIRPPYLYEAFVDLTVMPMTEAGGGLDVTEKARDFYWIIDDARTKVHIYDQNVVYLPFEKLQRDLQMDAREDEPARTTDIQISVREGVDQHAVKAKVDLIVKQIALEKGIHPDLLRVQTWEETHATFIGAVENEKLLVTFLFAIISVVAIFLIFCIFYMIVMEKTRDIGIIKSVGATSQGIAAIFLGYGAAIGVVGAMLGLGLAYLIVSNINTIHEWLGKALGVQMWNPEVYLFDTIPSSMNPPEVIVIVAAAIVSSIIGALVPAVRAARMHPIEALRWE
jgi:lipoprotein-releasing system permease protein